MHIFKTWPFHKSWIIGYSDWVSINSIHFQDLVPWSQSQRKSESQWISDPYYRIDCLESNRYNTFPIKQPLVFFVEELSLIEFCKHLSFVLFAEIQSSVLKRKVKNNCSRDFFTSFYKLTSIWKELKLKLTALAEQFDVVKEIKFLAKGYYSILTGHHISFMILR